MPGKHKEASAMRKGACITQFGIKMMSAEDCNIEILRLKYSFTPSTAMSSKLDSNNEIQLSDSIGAPSNGMVTTPSNLLLSTPLRFVAIRESVPVEPEDLSIENPEGLDFGMEKGLNNDAYLYLDDDNKASFAEADKSTNKEAGLPR